MRERINGRHIQNIVVGNSNFSALSLTICCCLLYSQQMVADAALFSAAAIMAYPCHIELKLLSTLICCHLVYSLCSADAVCYSIGNVAAQLALLSLLLPSLLLLNLNCCLCVR